MIFIIILYDIMSTELKVQRKMEKSPAQELIYELKKLWEKIRLKRLSKADRRTFVSKSLAMLKNGDGATMMDVLSTIITFFVIFIINY